MGRCRRTSSGGYCYHAINRGNRKQKVFRDRADYSRFMLLVSRACDRIAMRVLGWCLMPNHFHFVLWPQRDGDMSRWMHWLLSSHVRWHHGKYGTCGRIWQGRFKAFPIEQDDHLLAVLRYVERNPLRAGLVQRAEDWPWSSLQMWQVGPRADFFFDGPIQRWNGWSRFVNEPQAPAELRAVRQCVNGEAPFGTDSWTATTTQQLDLSWTLRGPGRPRS